MHRVGRGEIGLDLTDRSLLGTRQRVRQRCVEPLHQLAPDGVAEALRRPLELTFAQHEDELYPQQLVEREPPASCLLLAHRLGGMDRAERLLASHEFEPVEDRIGDGVCDPAIAASPQRLLDPAGQLPGVELRLLALGIDGHDPAGAVTDQVDDRIRHLQPTPVGVGLAEQGRSGVLLAAGARATAD